MPLPDHFEQEGTVLKAQDDSKFYHQELQISITLCVQLGRHQLTQSLLILLELEVGCLLVLSVHARSALVSICVDRWSSPSIQECHHQDHRCGLNNGQRW